MTIGGILFLTTVIFAAMAVFERQWALLPFAAPAVVGWAWMRFSWGRFRESGLKELKSQPIEETGTKRKIIWLNGDWALRTPGGMRWMTAPVPGDLAAAGRFPDNPGVMVYEKRFRAEGFSAKGGHFLCVGGVSGATRVVLNGRALPNPFPAFLPAEMDISRQLRIGEENVLRLEVKDMFRRTARARALTLGPRYAAGIFRDVRVEERAAVFIGRTTIAEKNGAGAVVEARLSGKMDQPALVRAEVRDAAGKLLFEAVEIVPEASEAAAKFHIPLDGIKTWTPDNPECLRLELRLTCGASVDVVEMDFGRRERKWENGALRIEGRAVNVDGFWRMEHLPPYGAVIPGWAQRRDLKMLREAGKNACAATGFPPHPAVFSMADREGVFLMSELPLETLGADGASLKALKDAVAAANRHPSFLFWLVTEKGLARLRKCGGEVYSWFREAAPHVVMDGDSGTVPLRFEEFSIDIWRSGETAREIVAPEGAVMSVWTLDGAAGQGGRGAAERSKAAADTALLKKIQGRGGVTLAGQLFSWGFSEGCYSASRKKKLSLDAQRAAARGGEAPGLRLKRKPREQAPLYLPIALAAGVFGLFSVTQSLPYAFAWPEGIIGTQRMFAVVAARLLALCACWFSFSACVERSSGWKLAPAGRLPWRLFVLWTREPMWRAASIAYSQGLIWMGMVLAAGAALGGGADALWKPFCAAGAYEAFGALMLIRGVRADAALLCAAIAEAGALAVFFPIWVVVPFFVVRAIVMVAPAALLARTDAFGSGLTRIRARV